MTILFLVGTRLINKRGFLFPRHPHFIKEILTFRSLISRLSMLQNLKNGQIKMVLKCGKGEKE